MKRKCWQKKMAETRFQNIFDPDEFPSNRKGKTLNILKDEKRVKKL